MLNAGTVVGGRYRLEACLASSGAYEVWRCIDEPLGRIVALKILAPHLREDTELTERFRAEAEALASINHPGVVVVYERAFDQHADAYLVMEYVESEMLSHMLVRVGQLTPARTMALVAQAADALHAGHEKGLVHCKVNPGNLLIRPDGTLVLTSFGTARSPFANLGAAGSVVGNTIYFSPEQALGDPPTQLSDIFALGLVAYRSLSGKHPFEGDNQLVTAMRIVRDPLPPLPRDVPSDVRAIVERALAKDPAARWPSGAALAQAAVGQ